MRGVLTRRADFVISTEKGYRHVSPPQHLVRDLLTRADLPLPVLCGITSIPIIRPDWSIQDEEGYDTTTALYYCPTPGSRIGPVPESPSPQELQAAIDLLLEVVCDFPFADAASKANALAVMVSCFLRPAIEGQIPISLIVKPRMGTGGTLLADAFSYCVAGESCCLIVPSSQEEEMRKKITTALISTPAVINIDNVVEALSSESLNIVLTRSEWEDRLLGSNTQVRRPNRAIWIATGNNIRPGRDLVRRSFLIRLDRGTSSPWKHEGFKHEPLLPWISQNRGEIIRSVLTIFRAFAAAGWPQVEVVRFGGFQDWANKIGALLAFMGVEGFLENLDDFHQSADVENAEWERFVNCWHATFGDEPMLVRQVVEAINSKDAALRDTLPAALAEALSNPAASIQHRLGKGLSRFHGRVLPNGLRVVRLGDDRAANVARWRVIRCEG